MSVVYNANYSAISETEVSKTFPVTEETVKKLIRNLNMLSKMAFPGQLVFMDISKPGVSTPEGGMWVYCSGETITNTASPFVGTTTPNLVSKYFRMGSSSSTNSSVGAATTDFNHAHGIGNASGSNFAELHFTTDVAGYDIGTDYHFHRDGSLQYRTSFSLTSPTSLERNHFNVAAYLKIT